MASTTTTQDSKGQHEEETYSVGDRVILQGLVSASELNGMHATVAILPVSDETSNTTAGQRFGVDLDLIMTDRKSRLMVKPSNLRREPPLVVRKRRAAVAGGSLVEEEGRPCSFCLDCVRMVVAGEFMPQDDIHTMQDLQALKMGGPLQLLRLNQLTASGWSHWNDPGGFHGVNPGGVYASLHHFVQEALPESNGGIEAMKAIEPTFQSVFDAVDDQEAVKGWNVRVTGNFWLCGMDEAGTYLLPSENLNSVYQCVGVRDPIWTKLNRPAMMRITMVPWYGRLVYDGVLMPPEGCHGPVFASEERCRKLEEAVEKAKREGRVVSRLAQLEVEGGSLKGVHDHVVKTSTPSEQDPTPTSEERTLLDKISNFPLDGDSACWVFRRGGYTEHENPNHGGLILSDKGFCLGTFECSALIPTSVDILKALMNSVRKTGTRPGMVGIDDRACCDRVEMLLSNHVSGTKAFYYAPPTPEETAAMMALGDLQHQM